MISRNQTEISADELEFHQRQRRSFLKRLGIGMGTFALTGTSYVGVTAAADNRTEESQVLEIPASEAKEHHVEINALTHLNGKKWLEVTENVGGSYTIRVDSAKLPELSKGEKIRAENSKRNVKRKIKRHEQRAMAEFRRNVMKNRNSRGKGRGHDIGKGKGHDKGNGRGHN